jgi:gliding motility-associated-like protein
MSIFLCERIRKLIVVCKSRCVLTLLLTVIISFAATAQRLFRQPGNMRGMDTMELMQQFRRSAIPGSQARFSIPQVNKNKQLQIKSAGNFRTKGYLDCIDTSSKFSINTDAATFNVGNYVKTADGNLLISGDYYFDGNGVYVDKGFLMKTDTYGTVFWTKLYDSLNHKVVSFINYYDLIELKDGSILLAGITNTDKNNAIEGDFILTKTDNTGNIIWSKTYTSRLWGTGFQDHFAVQQMKEDPLNEDIYITGSNRSQGYNMIKLSTVNGAITWSKLYQPPFGGYANNPFGFDIGAIDIISFACFQAPGGSYINAYRISKNNGDTIQAKYYQVWDYPIAPLTFFVPNPLVKLNNGNYALSGSLWGYQHFYLPGTGAFYQAGVVEMDRNLNFVNAYAFRNDLNVDANSKITIYPDGSGICNMIEIPLSNVYSPTVHTVEFDNGTILRQRKTQYANRYLPGNRDWLRLNDGGEMAIATAFDSAFHSQLLLFTKLHLSDTASECLGVNEDVTFTDPYEIKYLPDVYMDSIGSNVFQLLPDRLISAESFITNLQAPVCNQVSFCDTFAMNSNADSVCLFTPVNIKITKRRVCGSEVLFNFDSSVVQSFVRTNDSLYTVIFKAAWHGKIYGSLNGCRLLTDSLQFTALAPSTIVNLGADTMLCNSSSIVLHVGKGYESYQWQDGSKDSIFTVTTPGTYYVAAKNSCSGTFRDTIIIAEYAIVPFSLGRDTVLCAGNAIVLHGPSGYEHYLWQSGSVDTVLTVTRPGTYYLTANNTCAASFTDTIVVFSQAITPFNLGPDLSLCANDSITINAPAGFISYRWSPVYNISNTSSQSVVVHPLVGTMYKAMAEKTPGCFFSDSILVMVKVAPVISLGEDTSFCFGDSGVLNAGSGFDRYQWGNGNTSQSITVFSKGEYSVIGTTTEGCKSLDTLQVQNVWANPVFKLDHNAGLCPGTTRTLSPGNYASYLWQDGSLAASFEANGLGTYYVTVMDNNGCIGSDTVYINQQFPLPVNFLPGDTAICNYGEILLRSDSSYTAYLWSTGDLSASIKVTRAGVYTLEATNQYHCRGVDSIHVLQKDCTEGLYVPTAFSPNHDGKNDVFRPLIFGNVMQFEWIIYNRYGQPVFTTHSPAAGWDGTVKGIPQNAGGFVWQCKYQLEGEKAKFKSGTVILMR